MRTKYLLRLSFWGIALTLILTVTSTSNRLFALGRVSEAQVHESDIVINEIMYNPATANDYDGEWFEIANTSGSPIDINGWCIRSGTQNHTISHGGSLNVSAGGYLVLGRNGTPSENGGITLDYVYGTDITLNNSGSDQVLLEDNSCGASGNTVDQVDYGTSSPWPSSQNGHSIVFCFGSSSNNDGSKWQKSDTGTYGSGSNYGTPKQQNDCHDPTVVIVNKFIVRSNRSIPNSYLIFNIIVLLVGLSALALGAIIRSIGKRRSA